MRFLSIVCLAGMCGLAITMLFHFTACEQDSKKTFWAPYLVCLIVVLMGAIGFGCAWNAERNREMERSRAKYNLLRRAK
jgi:hypothetical protein